MQWVFPVILTIVAAWLYIRIRVPKSKHLTLIEYWVYVHQPKLPKTEAVMTRMISENPFHKRGRPPIGSREGALFTDIRVHSAVALRDKNPTLFRPDLFDVAVEPSAEALREIAGCPALIKCHFAFEGPPKDTRHLQFMPHLAAALADLAEGVVIFDAVMDRLFLKTEFTELLDAHTNLERIDVHTRLIWVVEGLAGRWETRGLRKIGLPELVTDALPEDEMENARTVMEELVGRVWTDGKLADRVVVEHLGATFEAQTHQVSLSEARVVLARVNART